MSNNRWTLADVQKFEARKNKTVPLQNNNQAKDAVNHNKVFTPHTSKEKDWVSLNIHYWANEKGLEIVPEYRFHPVRRFRFDWYFPALRTAIEFDGIIHGQRHTSIGGFSRDCTKLNEAQKMDIIVLRYTTVNHRDVIEDLDFIHQKTIK